MTFLRLYLKGIREDRTPLSANSKVTMFPSSDGVGDEADHVLLTSLSDTFLRAVNCIFPPCPQQIHKCLESEVFG